MKRLVTIFLLAALFVVSAAEMDASGRRRNSNRFEEIEGVITALSRDQLTIRSRRGDRPVRLTASTVVTVDGRRVGLEVLQIGDEVEVRLRQENDGTFTAFSIEIEGHDEASGVVRSVSATTLRIDTADGERSFLLTPATVVLIHDRRVSPGAIMPGMRVQVETLRGAGGVPIALMVEVRTELVEIEGLVTALSSNSITVAARNGTAVTTAVNPETAVRSDGRGVGLASLAVGSHVEVKALRNADGSLVAILIDIQDENELVEVEGSITAVGAHSITVRTDSGHEVTIAVDADTIVRSGGRRIGITDLRVGDRVEIEAVPGGSLLRAVRIEVEDEDERFVEIEGTVRQIAGSLLTIETRDGRSVRVSITSETVLRRDESVASVSDLQIGDVVEITARRNADGSLEALFLEIEDDVDDEDDDNDQHLVELEGNIIAVSATSMTLQTRTGQIMVAIDSATVVKRDDRRVSVADLRVGQRVEVEAQRNADYSLLAKVIEID